MNRNDKFHLRPASFAEENLRFRIGKYDVRLRVAVEKKYETQTKIKSISKYVGEKPSPKWFQRKDLNKLLKIEAFCSLKL